MFDRRNSTTAWFCLLVMVILAALVLCAAGAVNARADDGGDPSRPLTVGGHERSYLIHVPAHLDSEHDGKKLPVVMMLHGAGGDGAEVARQTGWDKLADKENFLVVYPEALPALSDLPVSFRRNPRFWSDGSQRGTPQHQAIDDVAFLSSVLDQVEKSYPVDTNRVYMTGFSSGASMTFHAAEGPMGNRLAAVAPVAGMFYPMGLPHSGRPTPLLLIFGTKDPLNPMEGGPAPTPWNPNAVSTMKVSDTVSAWAKLVGCPVDGVVTSDEKGVKRTAYGPGRDGVEFLFWTIDGMGHHWPGSKTELLPESVVGAPSDKLDGTDAIWKFLSRHTLAVRAEAP